MEARDPQGKGCAHDKDTDSANDEVGPCTRPHGAEQYDQQHLSGETGVLIEKRFTVEAKEAGVSMEGLKALLGKLDLSRFALMKG